MKLLRILLVAVSVAWSQGVGAALILNLDPDAESLAFSGSASGTAGGGRFDVYNVEWSLGELSGSSERVVLLVTSLNASGMWGSPGIEVECFSGGGIHISFEAPLMAAATTLSGTSVSTSYASFSDTYASILESYANREIPLSVGSGFGSLSIVAPVPEASSYALFCGLAALGVGLRRRRSALD